MGPTRSVRFVSVVMYASTQYNSAYYAHLGLLLLFLGAGVEVELDETYICKRKYNRGREVIQYWIFGGIERVSKRRFLVHLNGDARSAVNIMDKVAMYVRPGSIVYTDAHRSYNQLTAKGYTHHVINHSANFVRQLPGVSVHTQTVERLWGDMKEYVKRRGRTPQHIDYMLCRYIFIKEYGDQQSRFHHLLVHCGVQYKFEALQ